MSHKVSRLFKCPVVQHYVSESKLLSALSAATKKIQEVIVDIICPSSRLATLTSPNPRDGIAKNQ